MKKVSLLAAASVTSTLMIGAAVAPAAYAWHPKGEIVKQVVDESAKGQLSDANSEANAVIAAPGDVLQYSITVSNAGDPSSNGNNDMADTKLTDNLPSGIELVSDPSQRLISENLGTITPGQSVTKTYEVKVTDQTDGDYITNQACFTGNSTVNDNPQSGCDVAIVKVHVTPKPTPTPAPTPAPTKPKTAPKKQPTALPDTGASTFLAPIAALSAAVFGYAGHTLLIRRRING